MTQQFHSWVYKNINSERHMHLSIHSSILGGSIVENLPANARDTGSILVLGRSPGGKNGNPLHYSCLKKSHGQRSLTGYSSQGCKELDTTEQLSTHVCKSVQRAQIKNRVFTDDATSQKIGKQHKYHQLING